MVTTDDLHDLALSYMEGLDCPRSVAIAIMLRYEMWDEIENLEVNPMHYCDSSTYLRAAGATGFLSKFDRSGGETSPAVETRTFEKWVWAEKQCYKTNRFFDKYLDYGLLSAENSTAEALILEVRKNIVTLIGREPPPSYEGRFGPGATVSDRSSETTVLHKMSSRPTYTPSALFHLVPWTGTAWARALSSHSVTDCGTVREENLPTAVRGNVYFTVPKKATIRRACGKEASINGYYQLGLGRVMRGRLRSQGIDLDGNQDVHRRVACLGSKTDGDSWCTIDLSSASDTVAYSLVKLLLPHRWFQHLDALRSPFTQVNGTWYRLEKFSSMGNGYTFELETAIFTAIAMAMVPHPVPGWNIYCYGDDIIVPSAHGELLKRALDWFGFSVNDSKTFTVGPFRESCGGDFYNGEAVRPYFLKDTPDEPQKLISTANGIRRMAMQNRHDPALWISLRRTWFRVLDRLPINVRSCRGPEGLGDLVIHDDEERWNTRWRSNGIRYVRVYRPAKYRGVNLNRFCPLTLLAGALYGIHPRPPVYAATQRRASATHDETWDGRRLLVARDGVTGYKVGWIPYS